MFTRKFVLLILWFLSPVCALGGVDASVVECKEDENGGRVLRVKNSTTIPNVILDRLEGVSIGRNMNGTGERFIMLHEASERDEGASSGFTAISSNRAPEMKPLEWPSSIGESSMTALVVAAADKEGDALRYRWSASAGRLLFSDTETGWNHFLAPALPEGSDTSLVSVSVDISDAYGAVVTQSHEISVTRTQRLPKYQRAFALDLEEEPFDGNRVVSALLSHDQIHCTTDKGSYFIVNPLTHGVERQRDWSFEQVLSDGLALFGMTDRQDLLGIGRSVKQMRLPLSVHRGRKKVGRMVSRMQPPGMLTAMDCENHALDLYRLRDTQLIPQRTLYLEASRRLISGDWAYPNTWCALSEGGGISVLETISGTRWKVKAGLDVDASLSDLVAGQEGQLALRSSSGRSFYLGNLHDGEPFEPISVPHDGVGTTFASLRWMGESLLIGTSPPGIAFFDCGKRSIRRMGQSENQKLTHMTFLPTGDLLAYDEGRHSCVLYDSWGYETRIVPLVHSFRVDDLDAGEGEGVVALDHKNHKVHFITINAENATVNSRSYPEQKPMAISMGIDGYDFIAGDTRKIPFSGDRMMIFSQQARGDASADVLQVSQWESSKKAEAKDLSVDRYGEFLVGASDDDRRIMISRSVNREPPKIDFYSYEDLGLGRVGNIEVLNGIVYVLDVYPSTEVVMLEAETGRVFERWSSSVGKEAELAVSSARLVLLDRKEQRMEWYERQ